MGGSSWSDEHYHHREEVLKSTGAPAFAYSTSVKAGHVAAKVHDKLNPFGVTRESRDSKEHPESTAIGVVMDVTGSMQDSPKAAQKSLPQLMGLLLRKGYIKDPQILNAAVGDYYSDRAPLQVGQFESGLEMDDDLKNMFLEGGGGGSYQESYNDAMYFFWKHTSIDCWEKRGKKGYLFLVGDEHAYPLSSKDEIAKLFGDKVEKDFKVEELVAGVQEKYHLFFMILENGTYHGKDPELKQWWQKLVGPENVIMLQDINLLCETIGSVVGLMEGVASTDSLEADLKAVGVPAKSVGHVTTAVDPLARSLVKTSSANLPEKAAKSSTIERL